MRYVRIILLAVLVGEVLLMAVTGSWRMRTDGIEYAPAVPPSTRVDGLAASPTQSSVRRERPQRSSQPESGPWFVDRAHDFAMDVITTCGSPDKPSILHSLGSGAALFDVDLDGDLDIFVAGGSEVKGDRVVCAGGPWLFRNDGPGRWRDVTAGSGLRWTGWAQGVAVADYDADGDLDLFVTQHGPDTLWRNQGNGTFRDVTAAAGLTEDEWGVAAAWGDVDGDGWLDLYVVNYLIVDAIHPPPLHDYPGGVKVFPGPGMLKGQPDRLWRNRRDGTFEDMTRRAGVHRPEGRGMAAVCADFDGDGRLDLYVTEDAMPNTFWHGLGEGRFEDIALQAGVAVSSVGSPEGSMGVEVVDLDQDGRLDLIYSNFREEGTRVCRNLDGLSFQDITNSSRIGQITLPYVGWALVLADFDHDGWTDLFQVNGHFYPQSPIAPYHQPALMLRNRGRADFAVSTHEWGPDLEQVRSGRGAAAGDLDGDGDLDLVVTTIDGPLHVLINEGQQVHRASSLRLVGKFPNLEAVGASVAITVAGRTRADVVHRGGGFLSASDAALHVGLGQADRIEQVVVRWPDGSTSNHQNLPGGSVLTLRQGEKGVGVAPFR
jgi:hypothetical protein